MSTRVRLSNKIPLYIIPLPKTEFVTLLFVVHDGWMHEQNNYWGKTHLLEHLFFTSTKLHVASAIERLGGEYNAHVSREYSEYWIEIPKKNVAKACALLRELILTPTWDTGILESELSVVKEEHELFKTDYLARLNDIYEENAFHGALSKPIFTPLSHKYFSLSEMKKKHIDHWHHSPKEIIVAGSLSASDVRTLQKLFGDLPNKPKNKKTSYSWKSKQKSTITKTLNKGRQGEVFLGWGIPITTQRKPELENIFLFLLAHMESSRLQRMLRQNGLGYYVSAVNIHYAHARYIWIATNLPTQKSIEAETLFKQAYDSLETDQFTEEELLYAKEYIISGILRDSYDSQSVADRSAHALVTTGTMQTPQERIQKIRSVKLKEIRSLARSLHRQKTTKIKLLT